jgi:hypothetical protein
MPAPAKTPPVPSPEPTPKKTFTNWSAFEKAKVHPTRIVCDVIRMHPADESCKTRLPLFAGQMIDHFRKEHGGGFQVQVKQSDAKPWPGWKELADAGMEAVGLKCEVCDQQVQISPRDILNHLRPHQGKFRGAYQNFRDTFFLQIQSTPVNPPEDDDESFYSDQQ